MKKSELQKISKFMSFCLRHKPEKVGLKMDEAGWVTVEDLLTVCRKNNHSVDREILQEVVDTNDKKRFAFDETGTKIRASQGHSVSIELGYTPQKPPAILYHGTAIQNQSSIQEKGLLKQQRHHVHLSQNLDTAIAVGQRYGKPIVFEVLAEKMEQAGHSFFCSENQVWLTDSVPPEYLRLKEK